MNNIYYYSTTYTALKDFIISNLEHDKFRNYASMFLINFFLFVKWNISIKSYKYNIKEREFKYLFHFILNKIKSFSYWIHCLDKLSLIKNTLKMTDALLGNWKLVSSEGFDEYMKVN